MSQRLDGRLSRKERRRLKEHLGECASCARLAEMQGKQRRAFKGLALLPLPVGLTLFKGAPVGNGCGRALVDRRGGDGSDREQRGAVSEPRPRRRRAGSPRVSAPRVPPRRAARQSAARSWAGRVAKVAAVVVAATVATGVGYQGARGHPSRFSRAVAAPARAATRRAAPSKRRRATGGVTSLVRDELLTGARRRVGADRLRTSPRADAAVQNVLGARADAAQPAATSAKPRRNQDDGQTPGQQSSGRAPSPETPRPRLRVVGAAPPATIDTRARAATEATRRRSTRPECRSRPGRPTRPTEWLSRRRNRPWQRRWLRPRARATEREVPEQGGSQAGTSGTDHDRPVKEERSADQGKSAKP